MARKRTPKPSAREADLLADIAAIEAVAVAAEAKGSWGPAVAARAKIASLRGDLHRLRDIRAAETSKDPVEQIEAKIRLAEAEGSHQAVARLLATKADLQARLAHAEAEKATAEYRTFTVEDLLRVLAERIEDLPVDHVRLLHELARDRLADEGDDVEGNYIEGDGVE